MKTLRHFLCILAVLLVSTAAQVIEKQTIPNRIEYRIFFSEKINLPLKEMPKQLLKAWCQGYLKAYLPTKDFTEEAGYLSFVRHFGVEYQANKSSTCEERRCGQLDNYNLEPFLKYMDVVEENDGIKFVRLVFSKEFSQFNSDHSGPVFSFDDIRKLPVEQFFISNTNNKYANFQLAHLLAVRSFQSGEIDAEGKIIVSKVENNEKRVSKQDGEQ